MYHANVTLISEKSQGNLKQMYGKPQKSGIEYQANLNLISGKYEFTFMLMSVKYHANLTQILMQISGKYNLASLMVFTIENLFIIESFTNILIMSYSSLPKKSSFLNMCACPLPRTFL